MSGDISKKILDATLEIIAREKISGTRMHLIAKEAGMSQSNLHYYYPTKNDLLVALMDDLQERFLKKRTDCVDLENKSFGENISGFFDDKKDDILNHKKIDYAQFDYWVQGTVDPEIRVKMAKAFEHWRDDIKKVMLKNESAGSMDSNRIEILTYIMVSLMMGASMQYLIDEGNFDLDEYFSAAERMIMAFFQR